MTTGQTSFARKNIKTSPGKKLKAAVIKVILKLRDEFSATGKMCLLMGQLKDVGCLKL